MSCTHYESSKESLVAIVSDPAEHKHISESNDLRLTIGEIKALAEYCGLRVSDEFNEGIDLSDAVGIKPAGSAFSNGEPCVGNYCYLVRYTDEGGMFMKRPNNEG